MTTPIQTGDTEELALLRAATLGEYDIAGELGRGGMATVYLAHDIALDRKVAVKVMSGVVAASEDMVERFKREARTSAALSHPNIIPIYAVRDSEELLFFVMKLIEGRPLDCIIKDTGPLPIPMVEAIIGQVAEALGYAHRKGIIHRDVKPGNILIDDEGWCVVTDFGIAKVKEGSNLTSSGTMIGTPSYMSPEQCLAGEVTGASDQYALGVVAYEMLTGKVPFPGGTMMAVMYAHVHTPPQPILELRPDCPPQLADTVMRMLAKEPEDRFPSVEDAAASIGAQPLAYDDPTRSQMITLARSGTHRMVDGRRTPRSPIPRARTPMPQTASGVVAADAAAAPRHRLPPMAWAAVAAVALFGTVALLVSRSHRSAETPPAVAETAVATPAAEPQTSSAGVAQPPADSAAAAAAKPDAKPSKPAVAEEKKDKASGGKTGPKPAPTAAPAQEPAAAPAHPAVVVASVETDPSVTDASPSHGGGSNPASALLNSTAAPVGVSPATRAAIERTLRLYAEALAEGQADDAKRLYPDMPDDRHTQLAAAFQAGKRIAIKWRVGEINLKGKSATVRLRGSATMVSPDGKVEDERMDQEARLECTGDTCRIREIAP
jgi:serine/threonine-protein kinase